MVVPNIILIFIFVFTNYYNPISPWLTLANNVLLVSYAFFCNGVSVRFDRYIALMTLLILIWSMLVMILRFNIDMFVLAKYLRTTGSTFLIMIICSKLQITAKQIIKILSIVFLSHIMSIGLQYFFPQLDVPMANLFNFNREAEVITRYSIRKLGLSGGYDTASLISISSTVFFCLQYFYKKYNIYLFFALLSLLACTMSSRTGMVLGAFYFVVLFTVIIFKSKGKEKVLPILVVSCAIAIAIYIILPILILSTALFSTNTELDNSVSSTHDYTTGTVDALTGSHLYAMRAPLFDLMIGFGIDPNNLPNISTDIGYVKLIYHMGIIGLFLILLLYIYVFIRAITIIKTSDNQSDDIILSSFLVLYILLIVVMNYKCLEMYSRGAHDLLLIIFFVLTNKYNTARIPLHTTRTSDCSAP